MTWDPGKIQVAPEVDDSADAKFWRDQFLYAVSGLSWAVGYLESTEAGEDNYARRVLQRLESPRLVIPGNDD